MINNLEIIKTLLKFNSEDDFYFLEIIKRRKENPDNASNARVIKSFYIHSVEYLEKVMPEIIGLCNLENARAYINLNRRSFEKIAFQTLKKITDCIISKDFRSCKKAYNSACGSFSNESDKTWVIDIDYQDFPTQPPGMFLDNGGDIQDLISDLIKETGKEPNLNIVPTKNGYHIISQPFNRSKFNLYYSDIDIQTNSPTLLYIS